MANHLLNAVYASTDFAGRTGHSQRLVLLVLANHAHKESGTCYLSRHRIAYEAGVAAGHVPRILREIEAAGWVKITRPKTRGNRSNHFIVTPPECPVCGTPHAVAGCPVNAHFDVPLTATLMSRLREPNRGNHGNHTQRRSGRAANARAASGFTAKDPSDDFPNYK